MAGNDAEGDPRATRVLQARVPEGAIPTRIDPARAGATHIPVARPALDVAPGDRVGGYEVIRLLGRGGMGQVYAARDPRLGRRVAIKLMTDADPEFAARFLIEARATARCNHENIVVIHEVNEVDGHPFMVLEYLEGQTLAELLQRGPVPAMRAVELLTPVARALRHAHGLGIVHRDLKPENILVTDGGVVKVLDFGIAKAFEVDDAAVGRRRAPSTGDLATGSNLTHAGLAVGTPPYMAPEQLRGESVDGRADLWALGIVCYELIAGHHPLGPNVDREALRAMSAPASGRMPAAAAIGGVPTALAAVIDRCLAKRVDDRFRDAGELLAALEAVRAGAAGRALRPDECPYPGLGAFEERDAELFFGRDADVRRTAARLRDQPLLAIVGPSGAGKSSLVRAGLTPALQRSGETWEVVHTRPGRNPIAGLAALARELGDGDELAAASDRLRAEPGYLGALLRARARDGERRVLLVVDQLEELYTLPTAPEDRRSYTACLSGVADDAGGPLRVVVTMRSDFVDRASEDPAFMAQLARGLVFLSPLHRAGLRDALVRPAELAGYRFESDALVDDMLDELESASGALPLLQFAAGKLWDDRDRDARTLTAASYAAMGGLAGALASHADQVLAELPPDAQRDVRAIFPRLVTPERTRAIADLRELVDPSPDPAATRELIDQLVRARLLVVRTDSDEPTVEIVHESLITRWPTLAHWLDAAKEDVAFVDQLRTTARQWDERGRPQGLLWRGEALDEARRWRARNPGRELPARERAYVDAAFELHHRVRRIRRRAVIAAFLALAAIAAAAVIAMLSISSAEREARRHAEDARAEAEQRLIAERQVRDETARAEAERTQRERAERTAETASAKVEEKEEDLRAANVRLEEALAEARREAERARAAKNEAEREADRARTAEHELRAKQRELERLLAEKEDRVRKLEAQLRKISTDLK